MTSPIIRIAAALIEDGAGRLLLVRKAGTSCFMQAGGKIEPGEDPAAALIRELDEEIGLRVGVDDLGPIGCFSAVAANGPGHRIDATVFHLCSTHAPVPAAEIEEAIWIDAGTAETLTLAPLLREHILPWYRQMLAHP
ncbi:MULTISPECIES: NUDIX hydrolase [Sphingomonas]|uniref:NUDIX hydrolase n=1 Tax=Sphingomonas TaxID=13687 RepID=UPI00254FF349|nr:MULTISPECIES: NUDIX domain-containing protein [Sphingomonas]MDK8187097.1 NUDIX domain-containing protein [Sphingomonas zeae]MDK8217455.1 NUDIX domain-containing protein [Sphingomonas sp. UMB7805-LC452B]